MLLRLGPGFSGKASGGDDDSILSTSRCCESWNLGPVLVSLVRAFLVKVSTRSTLEKSITKGPVAQPCNEGGGFGT